MKTLYEKFTNDVNTKVLKMALNTSKKAERLNYAMDEENTYICIGGHYLFKIFNRDMFVDLRKIEETTDEKKATETPGIASIFKRNELENFIELTFDKEIVIDGDKKLAVFTSEDGKKAYFNPSILKEFNKDLFKIKLHGVSNIAPFCIFLNDVYGESCCCGLACPVERRDDNNWRV